MHINYRCYQMTLRAKHFYTNRERCEKLTGYYQWSAGLAMTGWIQWHIFVLGATAPQWARTTSFTRFLEHTHRLTTVGRTPLDEWSARCRDLYLTKHNTHNRQTSMAPVWFEPTFSAGEGQQTYALDREASGMNTWHWTKYFTVFFTIRK